MSNEPVIPPPGHGPAPGSGPASGPGATPPPATAAGAAATDQPASPPWGGPGGGGPEQQDGGPLATVQSLVDERPEILVGAAFLGGAFAALILKRFGR